MMMTTTTTTTTMKPLWLQRLTTRLRHAWWDESDTQRHIPPDMAQRLQARVAASEQRHTGQIRLCVEASLPGSYVHRLDADTPLPVLVRQRAVMMFSKLRVWDTQHHNGVLIYLLLAERAIEIVADRNLAGRVSPDQWQAVVGRLAGALAAQQHEAGLTQAIDETSALLAQHFERVNVPATAATVQTNELPDAPHLQ